MRTVFKIKGMSCAACQATIENGIKKLNGVDYVNVNLISEKMEVVYKENIITPADIKKEVSRLGYKAISDLDKSTYKNDKKPLIVLIISLVLMGIIMYISMGHMIRLPLATMIFKNVYLYTISQVVIALVVAILNGHYFVKGFKSLITLHPSMDTLISIGSIASFGYSLYALIMAVIAKNDGNMELLMEYKHQLYFESSVTIIALVSLGKYLESRAKVKSQNAVYALAKMCPDTVTIKENGSLVEINAEKVKVGDIVVVKPFERVPVDGVIVEGISYLNEATITGEDMPVLKKEGDMVISSSVNGNSTFEFKATKVGSDTTFARIIKLVEDASSSKPPIARIADKVSSVFVPIVMIIAVITFIVWMIITKEVSSAIIKAVSVLVIACPCALGLATPLAVMVGIGQSAKEGLIIKDATSIELLSKVKTIAFDKTGTITEGVPSISSVITNPTLNENLEDAMYIISSLEQGSNHPLASSFDKKDAIYKVDKFEEKPGYGVTGLINDKRYYAGSYKYLKSIGILDMNFCDLTKTSIILADEKNAYLQVTFEDTLKEDAKYTIEELNKRKIATIMITGDNEKSAALVAGKVGITKVISSVLPDEKSNIIDELKKNTDGVVAMVGDGVNDTIALTKADIGIAVGKASDVAIESADIVLVGTKLSKLLNAIDLSERVLNNIKLNLFWAFFYNVIGILLAVGVFIPLFNISLTPMFASLAMSLSSISVVLNALSLNIRRKKGNEDKMFGLGVEHTIKVEGMSCMHCAGKVEKALLSVPGVKKAKVSLNDKLVRIRVKEGTDLELCKKAITDAGYTVVEQ